MKAASKSRLRYLLMRRTPEQWEAALKSIRSTETRVICCCIVWFDFFSEREPRIPSPEVIAQARRDWDYWLLIRKRIRTTPKQLEAALVKLGYHPDLAFKRSRVGAE